MLGGSSPITDTAVTIAFMRSKQVMADFIEKEKLLPELYPDQWNHKIEEWKDDKPSMQLAIRKFGKRIVVTEEKDGLLRLTVNWNDAKMAQKISLRFIQYINELRRQEAIKEGTQNLEYLYSRIKNETIQELRVKISDLASEELRVQMQAQGPSDYALKVIDPAIVPEFKSSPKEILNIVIGLVFGLVMGIAVLLIRTSLIKSS